MKKCIVHSDMTTDEFKKNSHEIAIDINNKQITAKVIVTVVKNFHMIQNVFIEFTAEGEEIHIKARKLSKTLSITQILEKVSWWSC